MAFKFVSGTSRSQISVCLVLEFFFLYTKPSWFKFYFMVFWWKGAEQPPKENFLAVQPVGWDGEFSEAFFIHNRHYNGSISD